MVHKTRKHTTPQKKKGIDSIPELRRAFEHIEQFVDAKLAKKESKEHISKDLRKEWFKVFHKELKKPAADAFVNDRSNEQRDVKHDRRRTVRKGGSLTSSPLAGAPLDYTTRPGIYLAPGQRPDLNGGLPLSPSMKGGSNGIGGAPYGSFVEYVDSGFFNPEIAQSYDPVPGQAAWPHPVADMGSNVFKGGKRSSRRKVRGKMQQGGYPFEEAVASVSHAFSMRHIPTSVPPSAFQDAETWARSGKLGTSPDQVQRNPEYQLIH